MNINTGKIYNLAITKKAGETTIVNSTAYVLESIEYITLTKVNATKYTLVIGNTSSTYFNILFTITDSENNDIVKAVSFNI